MFGRSSFILLLLRCTREGVSFSPGGTAASAASRGRFRRPVQSIIEPKEVRAKDAVTETSAGGRVPGTNGAHDDDTKKSSPPVLREDLCDGSPAHPKRKMELSWCNAEICRDEIREVVLGEHNQMSLRGPATGQVAYEWLDYDYKALDRDSAASPSEVSAKPTIPAVLMLVKRDDPELLHVAAECISELTRLGVQVLVDSTLQGQLADEAKGQVALESSMIRLFDPKPAPGFGTGDQISASQSIETASNGSNFDDVAKDDVQPADLTDADLVVTLGGDGLLMYASHVFCGPCPPILACAGGSMGFLTPFAREEMLEAILISLGLQEIADECIDGGLTISQQANNNMQIEAVNREGYDEKPRYKFGSNNQICISMRMRLDCRIITADGSLRARHAVLNEVVIDRGSSPYLSSLECFCDDTHLTTVQADGIIFSTPTGSTAYSMAAGGSVIHPAVPCIGVTPICPHVLSFRSMVFPDHVVLRCYVPSDARSTACVYFDGKHPTELERGDSVQIQMSCHPVPTINRADHSADWLGSLKRNFNFNTRVRQGPL